MDIQANLHSINGKRRILIVEDEAVNRHILGAVLENDYELVFAADGEEALVRTEENRDFLALILLDLIMPKLSGMEVLKAIRENDVYQDIPVIVASADQEREIECLRNGASDFIQKPYPEPGVILARVKRAIELFESRQIIHSTERDPLTGLYNREFFYSYAEQFDLHHPDTEMDAIVLDINHFETINERYGKAYGDEVLRRVGEKAREMVHEGGGIVCRREADIFQVYCPHRDDYKAIFDSASTGLTGEQDAGNRVRLRMGVYSNVDKTLDIERRFARAKMAADTVRNSFTRNIGVYDDTLHKAELYSEQLIEDFPKAIEQRQFEVYFQPKYDIQTKEPVLSSAEGLVRWNHPELGLVSPGVFIPLFEQNGLIEPLDHYVWREAAKQIRAWKDELGFSVPVSVNVSRIDINDPNLIYTLLGLIEEYRLSADELHLEITESAYAEDTEQIIETVRRLRAVGFLVEMDDFGTGYSSLNMLSSLPIDVLKLDMKFIQTAFAQEKDVHMMKVIIEIARHLSAPVVAEGVETAEQLHALREIGCDLVQGYYFSPPVPAKEFTKILLEAKDAEEKREETQEKRKKETEESGAEKDSFLLRQSAKRNIPMRRASIIFVIAAFVLIAALFVSNFLILQGYRRIENANAEYILAQKSASDQEQEILELSDAQRLLSSRQMNRLLTMQTVLTIVILLFIIIIVLYIDNWIRVPLMRMVKHMQEKETIPPAGAQELVFVSETYNSIFEENRRTHDRLTYGNMHDALTGLFNRSAYDFMRHDLDMSHNALLVVDVDKFKSVNDTYGHEVGDVVLKRVAEVLKYSFRSTDLIYRLGGDEFVVIMSNVTSAMEETVRTIVDQANVMLQKPVNDLPPTSLSVGVAFADRKNPEGDIFKDADTALYQMKQSGRCGCHIY